jgi:hypothetical protein
MLERPTIKVGSDVEAPESKTVRHEVANGNEPLFSINHDKPTTVVSVFGENYVWHWQTNNDRLDETTLPHVVPCDTPLEPGLKIYVPFLNLGVDRFNRPVRIENDCILERDMLINIALIFLLVIRNDRDFICHELPPHHG